MAEENQSKLYVAREGDLDAIRDHWAAARDGDPRAVLLRGALGAGKRALMGEFTRELNLDADDVILWRVVVTEEMDGTQTLVRLYAGLLQALHRSPMFRGRVEMALNAQLPHHPQRVQGWYQAFVEGLKKGAPKPGTTEFQVIMPRDNPLIGLIEITAGIARKFPVVLDIQAAHNSQSILLPAFVEGVLEEMDGGDEDEPMHLLAVLGMEKLDDDSRRWLSMPFIDLLDRRSDDFDAVDMTPWGADEVGKYLDTKGVSSDAAQIARICDGRPGFIAELVDWLEDGGRLGDDLSTLQMADIADLSPDEDELEEPEGEPAEGERKHAGAADAERVAYFAALLGLSFPSALVADMAGLDRESVDDLFDATEDIYKELQFSKPMGTWVYQFHKALLRESVLARHTSEDDKKLAANVGSFMERFLAPRGYPNLIKTLRIYADAGAANRAAILRSMALGADQAQVWAMVHDLMRYFDDNAWPVPMRRTVYMHLIDRMVKSGDVEQTEGLYNEAMQWASENDDRPMQAWLLFAGSRLDLRRQDLYRARDRAVDALKLYGALEDKMKTAELQAHLAQIELQDGNPNAALDRATQAEEVAPVPPIQAQAEFVRGHVARRERKLPQATEHFRKANEIAGQNGLAGLALDSGLNFGETLLAQGQHSTAADALTRVVQIAQSVRNPVRERAATALLSQSHAALRNWEAALEHGKRTLDLTRALKFERLEAVDLYNIGFFNLMLNRPTEGVSLFKQSRAKANSQDGNFMKELLFNMGQAMMQIGEHQAGIEALQSSIGPATAAKDWPKVAGANRTLASVAEAQKDTDRTRSFLQAALQAADAGNLKEQRKEIRKKLDSLA